MARIRRICCASDLSPASRRAFDTAVALAKGNRASLTLVHVVEPIVPMTPDQYVSMSTWEQIDKDTRAWARRRLQALVKKAKDQGVRATARLVDGMAAAQITRAARSEKADLLVVGTHGRSGLQKFFLGSVAQRVVATAACPVLTVRGKV